MPGRTDETSADVPMEDGAPPSHQPTAEDEFANDGQQGEEDEEDEEELEQRVRILPGSTDTAASFEFKAEGHTLGNALRYIIMKNPDVEFCAYSIPHPSEDLMNIRIQTYDGTAVSALSKGLKDLQGLCDVMTDEFTRERDSFAVDKMES
ncbi:DNA-directed RNA polymerases I and III subunit RPAC2 like protein [Verticillium longisporum]|uniref:DNA-directed RNA polymerase RBP11-like dimerisation domain-containing protein n=2 Tax=Verticillium TaxID=1036719 RepID=A0A2J8CDF9_VERDA|nr:DNA-directed RNA polymerases I and III subunit RPAC2 like protein [Verticillium longisporum]KAH6708152.1 DNA-directed RNA polymerases I and III subunit RPAC2 [Verticillium dahliae]KAG7121459.1 DNA-directed RNA polymerases I and III subunit RPAC2 like protein [Verticillium longisporum]KAG7122873.1 DNA-directed RNA polymerases I and III subunit RPAC2 like protein [Verticillium longisporum]KAG7133195.1 DNA-directed RNA polymerases I and III subunit RPAC2 like protein [Verticillium longisporum]